VTAQLAHVAPAPAGDLLATRKWATAEALVCAGVLASLGLGFYLPSHVPAALLLVLATAPVWVPVLAAYRGGAALSVLVLAALVAGVGLTLLATGHHAITRQALASDVSLVLFTFCSIGVVLWGRERLGERSTGLMAGTGMVAGALVHGASGDLNFWKGGLSTPVVVLVLGMTAARAGWTVLALLALAVTSVLFDTRAQAVVLFLSALLVAWQRRPRSAGRRASVIGTGLVLAVLGLLAYRVGTQVLVSGYLGAEAQQRSVVQIDRAGSLLLGGRPEIAATLALMRSHVQGYGFGVAPRTADLIDAKQGLSRINYDPNNGYVERYMFGDGFELHSVVGDVWVYAGPVGLLLVAVVAVILVRGLADRLPQRSATGLVLFLSLWTFWNLLFSPLLNAALPLALAVGLTMSRKVSAGSREIARRA
jgi:hypothetical protein